MLDVIHNCGNLERIIGLSYYINMIKNDYFRAAKSQFWGRR